MAIQISRDPLPPLRFYRRAWELGHERARRRSSVPAIISKPFEPDELKLIVQRTLGRG